MRLSRSIQTMMTVTLLSLIYIHMQMNIIALAYDGKKKEQEIISLSERNGVLAYEILSLKSASKLGEKVLGNQSSLKFCDTTNVIQLVTAKPSDAGSSEATVKAPRVNPILSFFAKTGSEANAAEPSETLKPWRRSR